MNSIGSKPRGIHIADFSDRFTNHLLVPKLEKIISHEFIYFSRVYTDIKADATKVAFPKADNSYVELPLNLLTNILNYFKYNMAYIWLKENSYVDNKLKHRQIAQFYLGLKGL